MEKYALIVAGGSGSRMKSSLPKQFIELAGRPILTYALEAFAAAGIKHIIVVLPEDQQQFWKTLCQKHNFNLQHTVVSGGNTRFQSVKNGLTQVPENCLVAIHDGVRPLMNAEIIEECFKQAETEGSAIAAVPLKDSLREQVNEQHTISRNRANFWLVQTPQTFSSNIIKTAYHQPELPSFTDCASVAESADYAVKLIEGSYRNIKVTTPEDLVIAEALLKMQQKSPQS
jgi:2-C-methyl-D-erythritol 4-phosphate cytidylyltransferase